MNLNGNLFLRSSLSKLIGGTMSDNKYQKKTIKKRGQTTFFFPFGVIATLGHKDILQKGLMYQAPT